MPSRTNPRAPDPAAANPRHETPPFAPDTAEAEYAGGFGFALAGATVVLAATGARAVAPLAGTTLAAAFSIACATAWEIFEFALDTLFGMDTQKGFSNTMLDLIANALGAAAGAVCVHRWLAGRPESGPTRVLGEFVRANPRLWRRVGCGAPATY